MTTLVFKHPGPQKLLASCLLTRQHGGEHDGKFCLKIEREDSSIEVYMDAKDFADLISATPRQNEVHVIGDIRKNSHDVVFAIKDLPAGIRSLAQQHLQYGKHIDTCAPLVKYLKAFAKRNGYTNCYVRHSIDNLRNITITLSEVQ